MTLGRQEGPLQGSAALAPTRQSGDAKLEDWLRVVRGEYLESPGLCLTRQQVQRLWNFSPTECEAVLQALVTSRFLRRTASGLYVRWDSER